MLSPHGNIYGFDNLLRIFKKDYLRYKEIVSTEIKVTIELPEDELLCLDFKNADVCYVFYDLVHKGIIKISERFRWQSLPWIQDRAKSCTKLNEIWEIEHEKSS